MRDVSMGIALLSFAATGALITISPGPDSLLVLRTSVAAGPKSAAMAAAGICAGLSAWALAAAFGLSALLAASTPLYQLLKAAGAAYLCWLGVRIIRQSISKQLGEGGLEFPPRTPLRWFSVGLLTNLLNPKVGALYISLLPQFVPEGVAAGPFMLALAIIHILEGAVWFFVLIVATLPLSRWLVHPPVRGAIDRLTGVILIGLGVRLAIDRR
jgi:threonine/homoserine/homoserine lactone efflux protein